MVGGAPKGFELLGTGLDARCRPKTANKEEGRRGVAIYAGYRHSPKLPEALLRVPAKSQATLVSLGYGRQRFPTQPKK